jgi:hypothetical protein
MCAAPQRSVTSAHDVRIAGCGFALARQDDGDGGAGPTEFRGDRPAPNAIEQQAV